MATCAGDGHVLVYDLNRTETSLLEYSMHSGMAKKLAFDHSSPHIMFSCGEDGDIYQYDMRTPHTELLFSLFDTYSIQVNPVDSNLMSVGGDSSVAMILDRRMGRLVVCVFF